MISKTLKICVLILVLTAVSLVAQHPTMDPKTKDVPSVDYQEGPLVPTIDNYYLQGDPSEFIPDEFMSNPSGEVDPRELKGYHFPPQLKWVKVVSDRQIKAGGTLRLEAQAENPVPTQRWWIAYQNQFGRRSTYRANFRPREDNPWLFDGVVQIDEWAEPGVYVVYDGELNSELGHSKAFFPPMHPAMLGLEFEILPNTNVDVMYPDLVELYIGEDENMNGATFDIGDMIPVRAKLFDNKSGASEVILRLSGPDNKYIELNLAPRFNHPGEFVGYFQINQWSVGGEYVARTIQIKDRAGNQKDLFSTTNELLATAKFNIRQDPANVDKVPPKLVSVAFDRATASLEEETKIIAIAVDDHSGIGDIWVDVGASPSWIDKKRVRLKAKEGRTLIKPGFDVKQNIYEGSFKTHKLDEPGDWVISRVFVRDNANNYLDVRAVESPDLQSVKVLYGESGGAGPRPAATSQTTQANPQQADQYLTGADYFRQWRYNLKYFAAHKDYPASTRPVSLTTQNVFQDMWYKKRDRSPRQIIDEEFPNNMGLTEKERVKLTEWIEGVMSTRSYEPSLNHPFIPRSPFVEEGQAIRIIPQILQTFKPRVLIFQQVSHDTGHGAGGYLRYETGHDEYRSTAISTDEAVGQVIDFVKNDPYFSQNTAIVVRPEFGRDDEVNAYGEIHHSKGYYYAQRPASIYWGPDFNNGFDGKTVISRLDMAPTLTKLFNVDATDAMGQVVPGLFKPEVGELPAYIPYVE